MVIMRKWQRKPYLLWADPVITDTVNLTSDVSHQRNICLRDFVHQGIISQVAKFMGPSWGSPGTYRPQMGPMLAPWTLLSGIVRRLDVWKSRDSLFKPSCRFKIWQVVDAVQMLKRLKNLKHIHHSLFRDFMRSYDLSDYWPWVWMSCTDLYIPVSIN